MLPKINSGSIELLEHEESLRQLRTLERRRGSNRDRVDHPPNGSDDAANVVGGLLSMAARRGRQPGDWIVA